MALFSRKVFCLQIKVFKRKPSAPTRGCGIMARPRPAFLCVAPNLLVSALPALRVPPGPALAVTC